MILILAALSSLTCAGARLRDKSPFQYSLLAHNMYNQRYTLADMPGRKGCSDLLIALYVGFLSWALH